MAEDTHIGVYLCVEQPHRNGFVSHESLVVALGVRDAGLFVSSVGQLESNVANFPILVFLLFQQLDPHVGDCHGQSEPEADSSFLDGPAKSGEAWDIFSDEYDLWVDESGEHVGDGEVGECVEVEHVIEVFVIVSSESVVFAVVFVEHWCHSIEPEPVCVVLFQPESNVGEEEAQYFVLWVIEHSAVPERVVSLVAAVEVLVVGSVPVVYSL